MTTYLKIGVVVALLVVVAAVIVAKAQRKGLPAVRCSASCFWRSMAWATAP